MRRFKWTVCLAAWTVVLLLTACGGGGGGGGNGGGPVEPQEELSDILSAEELALLTPAEQAEAENLSGEALNDRGQALLADENILKAKVYFKIAANRYENQTNNEADTARFFYGLTRVLALPFDSASDPYVSAAAVGYDGSLLDFGDLLDAFGYPANSIDGVDPRAPENLDVDLCPLPLPANSPSGAQIQAFMDDVAMTEIEGALASLQDVSTSFNTAWTDPYSGVTAESDYGDVLAARAALKGITALIMILNAQNLDVDIDDEVNRTENSVEAYLARNQEFFTPIAGSVLMQTARDNLIQGAGIALDAIDFMGAETDPQTDDWINLTGSEETEIDEAKYWIAASRDALSTGNNLTIDNDTDDPSDDSLVDPEQLFIAGRNFRSFLPPYDGDQPTGIFPDPTFGGILLEYVGENSQVLNADEDNSGTADLFEERPDIEDIYYYWDGSAYVVWLHWDDVDDADEYRVQYYRDGDEPTVVSTLNAWHYFTNLPGGLYHFRIIAVRDGLTFPSLEEAALNVPGIPPI